MNFGKLSVFFIVLLVVTAQSTISFGIQDQTSGKTEKPETAKAGNPLEEDIVKNPLKPPNTSSPRATLQSFLQNIDRAYNALLAAHQKNMNAPGFFASDSILKMEKHAEILLHRSSYCLNLSGVPDELKQDVGFEGAIKLKEIFDRIELPPFENIPDVRAVEVEQEREKVAELNRWRIPNSVSNDLILKKPWKNLEWIGLEGLKISRNCYQDPILLFCACL